jgi:hypothetical protein
MAQTTLVTPKTPKFRGAATFRWTLIVLSLGSTTGGG